jgi:glycerol-3-phosphate acyltransferase PlsY
MWQTLFVLLSGYLLGSFPSGHIFSQVFAHRDVRRTGSGNVGGMNVLRNVGVLPGLLTGLFDLGKAMAAVWLARRVGGPPWLPLAAGIAAVVGHNWMIFLGLRGGKGLGATLGTLVLTAPYTLLYVIPLLAVLALVVRDTNVASSLSLFSLPMVLYYLGRPTEWAVLGLVLAVVVAIKHWPDYRAYLRGRRQLV